MNFALILFVLTLVTGVICARSTGCYFAQAPRRGAPRARGGSSTRRASSRCCWSCSCCARSWPSRSRFRRRRCGRRSRSATSSWSTSSSYGIRLPIIEQKIIPLGDPQRGDVVVFRYPLNPSQDFIKRVVGVRRRRRRVPGQAADGQRQAVAADSRMALQLPRGPAVRDARAQFEKTDGDGARRTHDRRQSAARRRCIRRTCGRFRARKLRLQ